MSQEKGSENVTRRSTGIVFFLVIVLIAFSVSVFNSLTRIDTSTIEYSKAIGLYPVLILLVLATGFVTFSSNTTPEQPVKGIHRACQKYEKNQKFEAVRPYLSKNFLRSPKILLLMQWHPNNIVRVQAEVTDTPKRMLVHLTLKNQEYYVFTVLRREQFIDPAGTSDWVIDDIAGKGF